MCFCEQKNRWSCVIAVGCLLLATAGGYSQQLQAPGLPTGLPSALPSTSTTTMPLSANTSDNSGTDRTKADTSGINTNQSADGVLTASQILTLLQARPELIVDLKQVMADYLQQGGTSDQADSITDDMLYQGITSNAGLRGAISIWLRARGYLDDIDLDGQTSGAQGTDDTIRVPAVSRSELGDSSRGGGLPGLSSADTDKLEAPNPDVVPRRSSPASTEDVSRSSMNR